MTYFKQYLMTNPIGHNRRLGQNQITYLQGQRGLTLIELLVALIISSVVAIAAVSALIVSRQGFSTVDSASQLRDNARFATDLIQRLGVQTGYRDVRYAASTRAQNNIGVGLNPDPNLFGANNATPNASDPANAFTARTTGIGLGSDVLVMRHQTTETYPFSGVSDKSMIDCAGVTDTTPPGGRDIRTTSIIHVGISQNEPSLMCTTVQADGTIGTPQPIIRGVENFQVLYGADNVVPNTAPTGAMGNSVPDRYLRADQFVVAGDPVGTNANWTRVRSFRIGMVLRGALGSAQGVVSKTYYPFGQGKDSAGGTVGSAFSSSTDIGTVYTPTADNRLRQVVTFTVHFRNAQEL